MSAVVICLFVCLCARECFQSKFWHSCSKIRNRQLQRHNQNQSNLIELLVELIRLDLPNLSHAQFIFIRCMPFVFISCCALILLLVEIYLQTNTNMPKILLSYVLQDNIQLKFGSGMVYLHMKCHFKMCTRPSPNYLPFL